jgi:hypothetical protein
MLDLVTVKFLTTYNARPFHLFGGGAAVVGAVGMALLSLMLLGAVVGAATNDVGVAKDGSPKPSFERGMELRARATLLAEGCHGSLSKEAIERFNLREGKCEQTYGLGLKVRAHPLRPNRARQFAVFIARTHELAFPLGEGLGGGRSREGGVVGRAGGGGALALRARQPPRVHQRTSRVRAGGVANLAREAHPRSRGAHDGLAGRHAHVGRLFPIPPRRAQRHSDCGWVCGRPGLYKHVPLAFSRVPEVEDAPSDSPDL